MKTIVTIFSFLIFSSVGFSNEILVRELHGHDKGDRIRPLNEYPDDLRILINDGGRYVYNIKTQEQTAAPANLGQLVECGGRSYYVSAIYHSWNRKIGIRARDYSNGIEKFLLVDATDYIEDNNVKVRDVSCVGQDMIAVFDTPIRTFAGNLITETMLTSNSPGMMKRIYNYNGVPYGIRVTYDGGVRISLYNLQLGIETKKLSCDIAPHYQSNLPTVIQVKGSSRLPMICENNEIWFVDPSDLQVVERIPARFNLGQARFAMTPASELMLVTPAVGAVAVDVAKWDLSQLTLVSQKSISGVLVDSTSKVDVFFDTHSKPFITVEGSSKSIIDHDQDRVIGSIPCPVTSTCSSPILMTSEKIYAFSGRWETPFQHMIQIWAIDRR